MHEIRKEVEIVYGMISQVNNAMQPRTKRSKSKIAEQLMNERYDRFQKKTMAIHNLLRGLPSYVAHKR